MVITQLTSPLALSSRNPDYESNRILRMHLGDFTKYLAKRPDETLPAPAHNDNALQEPQGHDPSETIATGSIAA